MRQFYLNNRPLARGLAVHHLANALPHADIKQVRDMVQNALMGHKQAIKQLAEYGVHIEND